MAYSQAWVPLVNQPDATLALSNPLLLTDGTVILHQYCGRQWYKLTPDQYGSYVNGTWKRIAPLPAGYASLYFGSAVLIDGRAVIEAGEYNYCRGVWTYQGAIYNPKLNTWTTIAPPPTWSTIGDASSRSTQRHLYAGDCCTTERALLDPSNLTWSITGKGKFDVNDEEGWNLLPDGTLLTVDAYIFKKGSTGKNYEIYDPAKGTWHSGPASGTTTRKPQPTIHWCDLQTESRATFTTSAPTITALWRSPPE